MPAINEQERQELQSIQAKIQEARRHLYRMETQVTDAVKGSISVHIGAMLAGGSGMMAGMDIRDAEAQARKLSDDTQAAYNAYMNPEDDLVTEVTIPAAGAAFPEGECQ